MRTPSLALARPARRAKATFEVFNFKGTEAGERIWHYEGSTATPPVFLRYEAFVLDLIRQTAK